MTSLTDFLLTRVAEDEEYAKAVGYDPGVAHLPYGTFVLDHPLRLLAEGEAKRQIVEGAVFYSGRANAEDQATGRALSTVLRFLALPYADHPDYRQEWRP